MNKSGVKLNSGQARAVAEREGPVLVIAGAGTGKTSVLVERVKQLIAAGTKPERILALTFTEKAAAEMQDRVNESLQSYHTELTMLTFNAFGESLLRRYASDIGIGRNFRLIGDNAQLVFLRDRLDQLNLDYYAPVSNPDGQLSNLSDYFSKLKQNVITPAEYGAFAAGLPARDDAEKLDKKKHLELANAYDAYIRLMQDANLIDYDDQIYLTIQLFRERPNVLKDAQNRFDYIMVDEFQDTNKMQSVLVDMLAGLTDNKSSGTCNLFVVGDDDQSIYGWRGATLANILDFKNRYPDSQEITLIENYRSTQEILDTAYELVQHNNPHRLETRLNINKKLTGQKHGTMPSVNCYETIEEELNWVAEDIKKHLDNGVKPGDIAVLARRNQTLQRIHTQLDLTGIDHIVIGQRFELYKEPIIRNIMEVLKSLVDPLDSTSLYHTLTGPFFNQSIHPLNEIAANANRIHQPLRDAIKESDDTELQTALAQIIGWSEYAVQNTVSRTVYLILKESGYLDKVKQDIESFGNTAQHLSDYFQTLREFESIAVVPSSLQYVESLPALLAAGESLEDGTLDLSSGAVNVLSIHKSKGLEWPIVYIVDCTEGSFPLTARSSGIELPEGLISGGHSEADDHMREERRLMYVAMTRAKNTLTLTYAKRHSSASTRKPSRFIREAFGDEVVNHFAESSKMTLPSLPASKDSDTKAQIPSTILHNGQVDLTVSQVNTYLDCPLDFYFKYILCVPQEPGFSSSYGTLMHSLLEELNRCVYDGKEIEYQALEAQLVRAWPQYGHSSPAQRERALEHAKNVLNRLCKDISSSPRKPIAIEESFKISLPDHKLTVRGRFDAVFPLGDSVEIVDYKTSSSVDTPEKAKSRASGSEQLTLYALAWQISHDELPSLVTLDFIDTGQRGSLKKTQRGIDGCIARLEKVADGIRNRQFLPGREHKFCIHPPVNN